MQLNTFCYNFTPTSELQKAFESPHVWEIDKTTKAEENSFVRVNYPWKMCSIALDFSSQPANMTH